MAERVAPDSVWRDIAGMLRSFDYAAASVPGPDSARAGSRGLPGGLPDGYAGGELEPGEPRRSLRAYEADKAIYEVVYEVRNRPDWVAIPLGAIAPRRRDRGPDGHDQTRPDRRRPTTHEGVSTTWHSIRAVA